MRSFPFFTVFSAVIEFEFFFQWYVEIVAVMTEFFHEVLPVFKAERSVIGKVAVGVGESYEAVVFIGSGFVHTAGGPAH